MYGTVSLLLCLSLVGLIADGRKTAREDPQKPDYIPGSYLQIEENEFDCYLEWWHVYQDNSRDVYISHYNKPRQAVELRLQSVWRDGKGETEIYPIYNEDRFYLFKSKEVRRGQENFGIYLSANDNHDLIGGLGGYITIKSSGEYSHKNKYAFLCRHWLVLNTTHAIDTLKMYNKKSGYTIDSVLEASLIENINSIHDDSCFRDEIVYQLDQCFNNGKYCAMNYDGDEPALVISKEHVISILNGAQLIMKDLPKPGGFVDAHHYVLKYGGHYYYFPTSLKTEGDGHSEYRISIFPLMARSDLFWSRVPHSISSEHEVHTLHDYSGVWRSIHMTNPIFKIQNLILKVQP